MIKLRNNGEDIEINQVVVKVEKVEKAKSLQKIKLKIKIINLENGLKNIRTVLIVEAPKDFLKNNIVNMVVKNNLKTILYTNT